MCVCVHTKHTHLFAHTQKEHAFFIHKEEKNNDRTRFTAFGENDTKVMSVCRLYHFRVIFLFLLVMK